MGIYLTNKNLVFQWFIIHFFLVNWAHNVFTIFQTSKHFFCWIYISHFLLKEKKKKTILKKKKLVHPKWNDKRGFQLIWECLKFSLVRANPNYWFKGGRNVW